MAQANSVQREPSMEEILASIRRIIEDSDGGRKGVEGPVPTEAAQPGPPATRAEVNTFRAELGAGVERQARPVAPESPVSTARSGPAAVTELARPFRLAEVQAQVAREAAAPPKAPDAERKPLTLADVQQQMARDTAQPAASATSRPAAEARPQPYQPQPVAAATEAPVVERREPKASPLSQGWKPEEPAPKPAAAAAPMPVASAAPAPVAAAADDSARQPIISQVARRQVAAAFGELSEAFAARSKKTFDEMAEQMLRPMLQEWLDNNLPLLVEKLVREEIERVARGA
jgi:cell pole-organizing protein PopZ